MELTRISSRPDWEHIRRLYLEAFPKCERKPFFLIRHIHRKGAADVWVIREEERFAGFAITLNSGDLVLLDYYAILPEFRSKGIGTQALRQLCTHYRDRRFFLEIESVYEDAPNHEERVRRKRFYLAAGLSELRIAVNVFGTNMELLGAGCTLTYEEYLSVYRASFGEWAVRHLKALSFPEAACNARGDML